VGVSAALLLAVVVVALIGGLGCALGGVGDGLAVALDGDFLAMAEGELVEDGAGDDGVVGALLEGVGPLSDATLSAGGRVEDAGQGCHGRGKSMIGGGRAECRAVVCADFESSAPVVRV
jgi:hypothetical protein